MVYDVKEDKVYYDINHSFAMVVGYMNTHSSGNFIKLHFPIEDLDYIENFGNNREIHFCGKPTSDWITCTEYLTSCYIKEYDVYNNYIDVHIEIKSSYSEEGDKLKPFIRSKKLKKILEE